MRHRFRYFGGRAGTVPGGCCYRIPEDREWAYDEAIRAGVDHEYAKRLLDPIYPSEPEVYSERKPRTVLEKQRTAFVFDAY